VEFILASSSPRRKQLLKLLDIEPRIIVPVVNEDREPGEPIDAFLKRVTISKGEAVYQDSFFHIPVISADTIVLCEDRLIGKPQDRGEAADFLRILSDNVHEVLTGLCILYRGMPYYDYACTKVEFNPITDEELRYYLDNEDYGDKAGAYAIQGMASVFVKGIQGCYFNVMGFPLNLFYSMLKDIGIYLYR
jgi:septum formation protein